MKADKMDTVLNEILGMTRKEKHRFLMVIDQAAATAEGILERREDIKELEECRLAALKVIDEMTEEEKTKHISFAVVLVSVCNSIQRTLDDERNEEYKIIG